MIYEISIIIVLIIANGFFAMSEMAIVAARKTRLTERMNNGSAGAKIALQLSQKPEHFLSTVQVGITLIGIFAGAFGGAALSEDIALYFSNFSLIGEYADTISFVLVVGIITYLSLIIGELVPKRIALNNAEGIAIITAPLILFFTTITLPVVKMLSLSTALVLKIFPQKKNTEPEVTEEEVSLLLKQAQDLGVFEESEVEMVDHIFALGDKPITSAMTPRSDMVWYNTKESDQENWKRIIESGHSTFPVCNGSLDKIIGMATVKDIWFQYITTKKIDIKSIITKPLYIPDTINLLKVVELLQEENKHSAIVVAEFGTINGIVTLMDILEAIVGEVPTNEDVEEPYIVSIEDGFLVDGAISIEEFKEHFNIDEILPNEDTHTFHTLAGFLIDRIGRIPTSGDTHEWDRWIFQIVDMDYSRIDKILVKPKKI